jgi:hypothetical protein
MYTLVCIGDGQSLKCWLHFTAFADVLDRDICYTNILTDGREKQRQKWNVGYFNIYIYIYMSYDFMKKLQPDYRIFQMQARG